MKESLASLEYWTMEYYRERVGGTPSEEATRGFNRSVRRANKEVPDKDAIKRAVERGIHASLRRRVLGR